MQVNKFDFLVWLTAALVTVFAGVEWGIGTSVALALAIILYKTSFPHTAVLGR